ncbi:hypothetical protein [Gulosibacter molinativorax]|uniref:Uncharacterized protein n=1 Tax=Gulosibacter molinativorax TaxID=256821 RepID=A0ABT7C552_9MICO|nr:hypothetical protein [Gulosibacter molinativorax]MDJ1370324.1 hypothetical protein [Gulosibacter molinativorax]QUY61235.1 Hypotetical protein [Gulosibacter molinativorax]
MSFIWVTRGRTWGFRFLRNGEFADPLPEYERAFSGVGSDAEVCRRVGECVALRFPDPEGRKDRAGRVIPHEFVLMGTFASGTRTVSEGRQRVWPLVADEYERIWKSAKYPSTPA